MTYWCEYLTWLSQKILKSNTYLSKHNLCHGYKKTLNKSLVSDQFLLCIPCIIAKQFTVAKILCFPFLVIILLLVNIYIYIYIYRFLFLENPETHEPEQFCNVRWPSIPANLRWPKELPYVFNFIKGSSGAIHFNNPKYTYFSCFSRAS